MPPTSGTDFTPLGTTGSTGFVTPNWILVARDGSTPSVTSTTSAVGAMAWSTSGTSSIVGRYAYAIYDEGGLIDANVAGYPSTTGSNVASQKSALAYADLTQIGLTGTQQDQLVAWRNWVTAQPAGASFTSPGFTGASGAAYSQYVSSNSNGFLLSSGSAGPDNQTDRMFISRQQLLNFLEYGLNLSATSPAFQYLSTFTRALNQPSIAPNPNRPKITGTNGSGIGTPPNYLDYPGGNLWYGLDNTINPIFQTVLVTTTNGAFTRNDGSTAVVGEPLVKKRFPLDRLAWLSYAGPISTGTSYNPQVDPSIITALKANYGYTDTLLLMGTPANIQKYFGLAWDNTQKRWNYNASKSGSNGSLSIDTLGDLAALTGTNARDPNFFEMLKAAIPAGSLGKNNGIPGNQTETFTAFHGRATNPDNQIIQIGANIMGQAALDGYPRRIVFDQGTGPYEFVGVDNLPYLLTVRASTILLKEPNILPPYPTTSGTLTYPGVGVFLLNPVVWNPHDPNAPVVNPNISSTLRPSRFRFVVDQRDPLTIEVGGTNTQPPVNVNVGYFDTSGQSGWQHTPVMDSPASSFTLDENTTELDFTDANGSLYREPTLLRTINVPSGCGLVTGSNHRLRLLNSGTAGVMSLVGLCPNGVVSDIQVARAGGANNQYAGVYLGHFPLAQLVSGTTNHWTYRSSDNAIQQNEWTKVKHNQQWLTYRLQYQDAFSNWVDHSQIFWVGESAGGLGGIQPYKGQTTQLMYTGTTPATAKNNAAVNVFLSGGAVQAPWWNWPWIPAYNMGCDVRSGRFMTQFCLSNTSLLYSRTATAYPNPDISGSLCLNNNYIATPRPGMTGTTSATGYCFTASFPSGVFYLSKYGFLQNGQMNPGLLTQNNINAERTIANTTYYWDADGVFRRAMGAFTQVTSGTTTSTIGLPMATVNTSGTTVTAQSQSRPYFLKRPFLNVAELGYVFSDTPWKNLDFFTPESGFSPLLDAFCIHDTVSPIVAGKVNLNTRNESVLAAILNGAKRDAATELPTPPVYALPVLSPADAAAYAKSLVDVTTGRVSGTAQPLTNVSDLTGRLTGSGTSGLVAGWPTVYSYQDFTGFAVASGTGSNTAATVIQRFREASIRPLADCGQVRVWNLLIDIIAQTGRYPASASNLSQFTVEGEKRYWVHLAIDRQTGQILDSQLEPVHE